MASTTIEDTLDQLSEGLDQLRSDLRKRAQVAAKTVRKQAPVLAKQTRSRAEELTDEGMDYARGWISAGRKAWDSATEGVGDVSENVAVVAAKARDVFAEAASQADRYGRSSTKQVRTYVRQRPVTSLLIATAAGLLIGRLLSRD